MLPGYYFESAFSTYETIAQSAVRGQTGMASKVQKELWKSLGMLSPKLSLKNIVQYMLATQ
jgi:hypothetical protein